MKKEADFSRAFTRYLRSKGCFVQRIESGMTGAGIPDLFFTKKHYAFWCELKRIRKNVGEMNKITWRPGQQVWCKEVSKCLGITVYTIARFNDKIGVIRHNEFYENNMVPISDMKVFDTIEEVYEWL